MDVMEVRERAGPDCRKAYCTKRCGEPTHPDGEVPVHEHVLAADICTTKDMRVNIELTSCGSS